MGSGAECAVVLLPDGTVQMYSSPNTSVAQVLEAYPGYALRSPESSSSTHFNAEERLLPSSTYQIVAVNESTRPPLPGEHPSPVLLGSPPPEAPSRSRVGKSSPGAQRQERPATWQFVTSFLSSSRHPPRLTRGSPANPSLGQPARDPRPTTVGASTVDGSPTAPGMESEHHGAWHAGRALPSLSIPVVCQSLPILAPDEDALGTGSLGFSSAWDGGPFATWGSAAPVAVSGVRGHSAVEDSPQHLGRSATQGRSPVRWQPLGATFSPGQCHSVASYAGRPTCASTWHEGSLARVQTAPELSRGGGYIPGTFFSEGDPMPQMPLPFPLHGALVPPGGYGALPAPSGFSCNMNPTARAHSSASSASTNSPTLSPCTSSVLSPSPSSQPGKHSLYFVPSNSSPSPRDIPWHTTWASAGLDDADCTIIEKEAAPSRTVQLQRIEDKMNRLRALRAQFLPAAGLGEGSVKQGIPEE